MERTKAGRADFLDQIEEFLIALILGVMTIVTFANVIARYVFNSNILWALETTVFLFAWLVLLGAAYCIKTRAHLGVDVVINLLSPSGRRALGLISAFCCLVFATLLFYGALQYWVPFATKQVWYEVNDIPMPDWLRFIEPMLNEGEAYEKLPRFIPYAVLPISLALIVIRFSQVTWSIYTGEQDRLIASHEAEDLVEDAARNADREE